eukprot:TRINITY_DN72981_c0_g1_i1.p1 TRINITY_DN72981_c0_g1~~TRINITY_DN72981_c0_g1_i1.p1  ORF type:complete len:326 (+),score=40.10 TRINITY_DN72981_c0_g1_i1:140-1117(+)
MCRGARMISLRISRIDGTCCNLDLQKGSQIDSVKAAIAEKWTIPKRCQQLLHCCIPLDDKIVVDSFESCDDIPLEITMFVSMPEISGSESEKMQILQDVATLGARGGDAVPRVLHEALESATQPDCVVQSATDILTTLAENGSFEAASVLQSLEARSQYVQRALGKLSERALGCWLSANGTCSIGKDFCTGSFFYAEPLEERQRLHSWLVRQSLGLWQGKVTLLKDDDRPWYGASFGPAPEFLGHIRVRLVHAATPSLQTQISMMPGDRAAEDFEWEPVVTFHREGDTTPATDMPDLSALAPFVNEQDEDFELRRTIPASSAGNY